MKYHLKKRLFATGACAFLFLYTCVFSSITVFASPDFKAEAEARKALPVASNSYEDWPNGPAIGAQSAILMEANTGTILYEKNIHEQLFPASTTKILTCLIAAENCEMNETVTFSKDAVFSIPRDSSNIGMDVGESITVEQCLYGILVGSANEAANAIAEHVSGSMEAFIDLMNETAETLGCTNSHFLNANGLPDDNHYTSAYDLATIGREFFKNELLCKMSNTPTYYIPQSPTQPDDDLYIHSKNQLYSNGANAYEYLVGSKTGYTDTARQTLVSCAEKNGMRLICVIFKEESPAQFTDTVALFNYGFDNFQTLNVASNETEYTIDNNNFFQTDSDVFGNSEPILSVNTSDYIVLPITAVFSDADSSLSYEADSDLSVARIDYTYHGVPVGSATVDFTLPEKASFDFESQTNLDTLTSSEDVQNEDAQENVVFLNVKKIIFWVLGISGFLILLFVIRAVINNYQFARRRKARLRHKKRRKFSEFDDFDI